MYNINILLWNNIFIFVYYLKLFLVYFMFIELQVD